MNRRKPLPPIFKKVKAVHFASCVVRMVNWEIQNRLELLFHRKGNFWWSIPIIDKARTLFVLEIDMETDS